MLIPPNMCFIIYNRSTNHVSFHENNPFITAFYVFHFEHLSNSHNLVVSNSYHTSMPYNWKIMYCRLFIICLLMYMNKLAQTNYTHNLPLFLLINNNDDKMIYLKKIFNTVFTLVEEIKHTHIQRISIHNYMNK